MKLMRADRALAERHYDVHRGKPFFDGLIEFITSAPLVAMAVEGPNAIAVCREVNGATKPLEAKPGSIRGYWALDTGHNLVHGSDSAETAERELALWFKPEELLDYERALDSWVLDSD
jgi:nucleoside-diphosphate kinase